MTIEVLRSKKKQRRVHILLDLADAGMNRIQKIALDLDVAESIGWDLIEEASRIRGHAPRRERASSSTTRGKESGE